MIINLSLFLDENKYPTFSVDMIYLIIFILNDQTATVTPIEPSTTPPPLTSASSYITTHTTTTLTQGKAFHKINV